MHIPYDEPLNRLDFADNPAEYELQKELRRLGVQNEPRPTVCPCINEQTEQTCGSSLDEQGGMVGETVLVCPTHGIVWEDSEGAIRNVY